MARTNIRTVVQTVTLTLAMLVVGFFITTTTALAATDVVSGDTASGENQSGWMFNRDSSNQAPFSFSFDKKSIGNGSLFVPAITNTVNGNNDKFIAENFLLTPIAEIDSISYDFLTLDESDTGQFYMNVYANFGSSTATNYYDCKYDVSPSTGSSASFTTVTFDPTQSYQVTKSSSSPEDCPAKPAEMNASSTGATIRAIALNVGDTSASDTGVSGYLDNVVVTLTSGATVSDFEPEPLPTPDPLPTCDSGSTFDSSATGTVNGQGGWTETNATYDQAIVDNSYGFTEFGCKSLRVSNAVTSGGFDWIYSPSTTNEAGEASSTGDGLSGGSRQSHFEAEFDIASAQSTEQTGLQVSVSPDRGDGSRMSYLRFEDESDGIHVYFNEYASSTFEETDIATLNRTDSHSVKFVIDFVDGLANDVVSVYIDGSLEITGTTWEDYFRDQESREAPTVDSLLIQARSGQGSATTTQGKGFLFDNVSLSSGAVPVVVTPEVGEDNGGGSSSGGGRRRTSNTPAGEVLGASTTASSIQTPVIYHNFTVNLTVGSRGVDVTNLQAILIAAGYLQIAAPTGYFGPLTEAAVKLYQAAHGIPNTGLVGPLTRASLNTIPMVRSLSAETIKKIADILAQIAVLQAALDRLK